MGNVLRNPLGRVFCRPSFLWRPDCTNSPFVLVERSNAHFSNTHCFVLQRFPFPFLFAQPLLCKSLPIFKFSSPFFTTMLRRSLFPFPFSIFVYQLFLIDQFWLHFVKKKKKKKG